MEKGEIAHFEQFHLFPQCFPKAFYFSVLKLVYMEERLNSCKNGTTFHKPKSIRLSVLGANNARQSFMLKVVIPGINLGFGRATPSAF